ncbi:MAG: hypothetical protein NTX64_03510 [Elusimicrobia bacterium]|nr:hypothetical protein [Elusimicrobiota bacterium]
MGRAQGALLGLLSLAGVGAFAAYKKLGSVIKDRLERYASKAAGTAVSVREVSVNPWTGAGSIRGLVIGNPAGFKTESVFRVDDIRVRLEPKTLLSGTIRIKEMVLDSPVLTWELGPGGGNLGRIRKNLEARTGTKVKNGKRAVSETSERRLIVERFVLRNARLRVARSGLDGPVLLPMPDLKLEGLGEGRGGDSAQQILSQILDATIRSGLDAAGGAGDVLRSAGKAISKTLGSLFKKKS